MIRVLDICKTNGRVENGNNVQIYTNVDPKAQEWLILPVDADNFRIVPRSNMRLSLTSYGSDSGTASGRTSASAGNVFVSTYTGNNPNQLWQIYKIDRTQVKNDYIGNISSNTYYVINRESGNLIKNTNNSLLLGKGTSDIAMISRAWKITKIDTNTYTVQPENRSDLFLCGNTTAKTVSLQGAPNHYWSSEPAAGIGGLRLTMRSGSTKYALTESNGSLVLQTVSTQSGTSAYYRQAWYFYAVDTYTEITKATFSNLNISYGNTASAKVTSVQPTGAAMTAASNFTYTGGGQVVSIDNLTGTFKGLNNGTVTITATHKVHTNVKATFSITVTGKPDPEPEIPQYNPDPTIEISTNSDLDMTKLDGRYFQIPHTELSIYGGHNAQKLKEMLNSRGMNGDGVEIFDTECVIKTNPFANEYHLPVNEIVYYTASPIRKRPFLETIRRSKVAIVYTHGNPTQLSVDKNYLLPSGLFIESSDFTDNMPDDYFSYCQLIILVACSTAGNTNNESVRNIADSFKAKGAQNIIAFTQSVPAEQATALTYTLLSYLTKGTTNAEVLGPKNDPISLNIRLAEKAENCTIQEAFDQSKAKLSAFWLETEGSSAAFTDESVILIRNEGAAEYILPYQSEIVP